MGGSERVEGYGKARLIGEANELEDMAQWYVQGKHAMREGWARPKRLCRVRWCDRRRRVAVICLTYRWT
ncbi:hypothetical protein [Shimia sp.]|uniref:hypothetical protein n=1 Tax=Shimia sp. TaxID=1954381 RepID=UPI00329809AD